MARRNLSDGHRALLAELYSACGRTLDDLPYTEEFEALYVEFCHRSGVNLSRNQVWRALTNCRKASKLQRKQR